MSEETDRNNEKQAKDIRRARRMLRELYSLAEHASLSGAFRKDGAVEGVQAYNQILRFLGEQAIETNGMFLPLAEDASFDRLGVAARLLRGYLEEEEEGDTDKRGVKIVVGKHGEQGGHIAIEELGRLKDIGAIIREHLPDFLRTPPPAPPMPPTPPAPPAAPTPPVPPHDPDDE